MNSVNSPNPTHSADTSSAVNAHTQKEIAKFDALANEFWEREGRFKALHDINPLRVHFCEQFVALSGARVADIGCGGGILSEALDEKGAHVTAIDLSEQVILAAKSHQQQSQSRVDYRVQSIAQLAEEVSSQHVPFDAVFCMEMLEHVDDPSAIIAQCTKLLKPNGTVVFSTLNRTLKARVLAVWAAENLLGMVPKGTHDWQLFIKPSEMERMARAAGLVPLDIIGVTYRPLSRDFVLRRDTDINYIFAFQKPAQQPDSDI